MGSGSHFPCPFRAPEICKKIIIKTASYRESCSEVTPASCNLFLFFVFRGVPLRGGIKKNLGGSISFDHLCILGELGAPVERTPRGTRQAGIKRKGVEKKVLKSSLGGSKICEWGIVNLAIAGSACLHRELISSGLVTPRALARYIGANVLRTISIARRFPVPLRLSHD